MAVTYELYVKQKGRWNLEAQFKGNQRKAAIDEAKELERQSHIDATKVMREKIDDATGENTESTIFNSEHNKTGRLSAEGGGGMRAGGFADIEVEVGGGRDFAEMQVGGDAATGAPAEAPAKAPKARRGGRRMSPQGLVLYKLFIVAVTSFGFAALVTWIFLQTGVIAFA